MIAASAWPEVQRFRACNVTVRSDRGGIAENPIRNVRGVRAGEVESLQARASPQISSMRRTTIALPQLRG
jgi:hypothetical protein